MRGRRSSRRPPRIGGPTRQIHVGLARLRYLLGGRSLAPAGAHILGEGGVLAHREDLRDLQVVGYGSCPIMIWSSSSGESTSATASTRRCPETL